MSNDIAIKVYKVCKTFKLPHQKINTLKGVFLNLFNRNSTFERQKVLQGISFEVKKGEFLGIVGRNGGGKSTLLKLLAGIYLPDSGSIDVNGRLTPFIELGVGFNPDLTGRENIYLNGALLGVNRKTMDAGMYDRIVEFAELEKFMDQKLKNYSSGMQVRLAFSVAIQAKTDILLIDEVLAVGDANFQKKCFDVFEQFKAEGRTVIFISHSMAQVKRFCDRVILINRGKIMAEGDPDVVAVEYDMLNNDKQKDNVKRLEPKTVREAHLMESVLAEFKQDSGIIEIGSGDGRMVKLIESLNIDIVGLDPLANKKQHLYNDILEIKDAESRTGLLILDNLKSLSIPFVDSVFMELDKGRLTNVKKIYIHLPFHIYQEYVQEHNPSALSHLSKPLNISNLITKLNSYGFAVTDSGNYGSDDQPFQYVYCSMKRFNKSEKEQLWEYSRK